MFLMVQKGISRGICHAIHQYATFNNKYMKDYNKNKKLSCLKYSDVNNLYGWAMSQKLLKWVEKTSEFNENFIKSHNNESHEGYDLEIDV